MVEGEFGEPYEEEVEMVEETIDVSGKKKTKKPKEVEGVDYILISIAGKKRKFPNNPETWKLSLKQFNAMTMEELEKALELGFQSI